jgi:adenylate cyclase
VALEIERKFLLSTDAWRDAATAGVRYRQGYLCVDPLRTVRVRLEGDRARLAIKGLVDGGLVRREYEVDLAPAMASELLEHLCLRPLVEKTRHKVKVGPHTWEIDVFEGDNAGLVVAEIELTQPEEVFERPTWLGAEVTDDPRYLNSNLVARPFSTW